MHIMGRTKSFFVFTKNKTMKIKKIRQTLDIFTIIDWDFDYSDGDVTRDQENLNLWKINYKQNITQSNKTTKEHDRCSAAVDISKKFICCC
jgi:hypothetical protein